MFSTIIVSCCGLSVCRKWEVGFKTPQKELSVWLEQLGRSLVGIFLFGWDISLSPFHEADLDVPPYCGGIEVCSLHMPAFIVNS